MKIKEMLGTLQPGKKQEKPVQLWTKWGEEIKKECGLCAPSGISETTNEAWGLYDLKRMVGVSDCIRQGAEKSYLWERI